MNNTIEKIITAPHEDDTLDVRFVHSFTKTDPDVPVFNGMRSYTVYLAKAVKENAQIVISAKEDKKCLSVTCGPLKNKNGDEIDTEIFRQYYIKCKDKYYPDPIAPMNSKTGTFDLKAGKSQAIYIQVKTTADTPAGDYSGIVSVCIDGKAVKMVRLFAHVWDIVMPKALSVSSVSLVFAEQLYRFHDKNKEKGIDYYKIYYDYLLDNRINPYDLPYDIMDVRADAYMSDPRVKFFKIPITDDDAGVIARYEKLKSNEEWFKKAYFYPYDEPGNVDMLNEMAKRCRRLKELCPGIHIVVPFFQNVDYDKDRDQLAFMSEYMDVWCPKSFCFTKTEDKAEGKQMLYSEEQLKRFPEFGKRMKAEKAEGDLIWWYVCWEPGMPYLNMYVDMQGYMNRLLFWQQKQYDVTCFLYWACNFWNRVDDPWKNMATVGTDPAGRLWLSDDVFGDGSYIYPGSAVDVDGPCGSVRLECIRGGLEDYEMLCMLEKAAGKEKTNEIISLVSESIVDFTMNEEDLVKARIELGNALEEMLRKK